ncbi:hypothetical protein D3C84_455810 [compost metagenome]
MNAIQIDIFGDQFTRLDQLAQVCGNLEQGKVEDLATVHEEHAIVDLEEFGAAAISTKARLAQLPACILPHPGDRSSITKEHGGVTVLGIDNL